MRDPLCVYTTASLAKPCMIGLNPRARYGQSRNFPFRRSRLLFGYTPFIAASATMSANGFLPGMAFANPVLYPFSLSAMNKSGTRPGPWQPPSVR